MKKKAQEATKFFDNVWNVAVLAAIVFAAVAVSFKVETPAKLAYAVTALLLADALYKVYKLQSK